MENMHYVGLDVHKKTIAYSIKLVDGKIINQGTVSTDKIELTAWAEALPCPRVIAMEATMFSGWIYDFLAPYSEIKVVHPVMFKAIVAGKKKSDKLDAAKIADLLRCNLLPECYMAPNEFRELRRVMRYRNMIVQQAVKMKNKISGLLMEVGEPERFPSTKDAVSYCGLCSAHKESAGKSVRGPISKKRNKHLQHMIIEAAKIAPKWNEQLADVYAKELAKGEHRNTATYYVCRLLNRTKGNVTRASEMAGLSRTALQKIMRRQGIRSEDFR